MAPIPGLATRRTDPRLGIHRLLGYWNRRWNRLPAQEGCPCRDPRGTNSQQCGFDECDVDHLIEDDDDGVTDDNDQPTDDHDTCTDDDDSTGYDDDTTVADDD